MKRVSVKGLHDAFDYVMQHYYPAGLAGQAERSDTYAVISIQDTHTEGFGLMFQENSFCRGVLTLFFDDIIKEVEGAVLFSEEMAGEIIRFVKEHMEVDTLLIHCYAGQSRSRAVGAFVIRMLGADNSSWFKKYNPNLYVYELLCKVYAKTGEAYELSAETAVLQAEKAIEGFCRRIPKEGFALAYVDQARELSELYEELTALAESDAKGRDEEICSLALAIIRLSGGKLY